MDATSWLKQYAEGLGMEPPSEEEQKTLLSLASVAANASERLAAPLSCWMVAKAGRSPEEGLALARRLAPARDPASTAGDAGKPPRDAAQGAPGAGRDG